MPPQTDILIVGAGAIGCSLAYHLAKQGVAPQVIDRESIAARASGKSWAVFAYPARFFTIEGQPQEQLFSMPPGSVAPWLHLIWQGYHRIADTAAEIQADTGIDIGYGELAWVRLAFTEAQEAAERTSLAVMEKAKQHESYWMPAGDLRRLFPDLNAAVRGGMVLPYQQIEPYRYTLGLAQLAEKRGASFRNGEVVGFRTSGSRVLAARLSTGTEIAAERFILATGPWSGQATSHLGKELPIIINREQCLRMEVPKKLPPFGLAGPNGQTIVPKVGGDVILGHAGLSDLQTNFDVSLTTEDAKLMMLNDAMELLPSMGEAKLVEQRGDFECWSPPPNRIRPVLGLLPDWDNVYLATRFGTLGMMMSLGAGRILSELILHGKPPERFRRLLAELSPAAIEWRPAKAR
ncbi:MAG TPA: FAD-dependent oxidoreductase [Candidatus Baltobacteraceae bacterium]|nr:FAD-dependent oxidoreductase [Candidatus Baltobacteraceae bacterium]